MKAFAEKPPDRAVVAWLKAHWVVSHPNIGRWLARIRELDGWADPYELLRGERIAPRW